MILKKISPNNIVFLKKVVSSMKAVCLIISSILMTVVVFNVIPKNNEQLKTYSKAFTKSENSGSKPLHSYFKDSNAISTENSVIDMYPGVATRISTYSFTDSTDAKMYFLDQLKVLEGDFGKLTKSYDTTGLVIPASAYRSISDYETIVLKIERYENSYFVTYKEIVIQELIKNEKNC